MFYEDTDLIDTRVIQPGDGMEVLNGGNPPPPSDDTFVPIDWRLNDDGSVDAGATFGWGDDGSIFGSFNFDPSEINSITFGFSDGTSGASTTFDFDNQGASQSYYHDFGGGVTGYLDISLSPDGSSATASLNFIF